MAKKAILDVLENTIGRYVLNLDAQSLNVAVWSGKIELNHLELDTHSINKELERQAQESPNLALPVRVIGGHFETLQVDVPWTKITSKPVIFRAKNLNIIIAPYNNESNMPKSFREGDSKKKSPRQHAIDIAEEARQRTNAIRDLADDNDSEDESSFTGRLVRRIAENLQVDIEDVHISLRGCGASAGIVLESLSLTTTDENGERKFIDRAIRKGSFLHKALNITGFGIYLDEYNEYFTAKHSAMKSKSKGKRHSFILSPLSFQASLRQSDSVKCIDFPKYLLASKLSSMSITLSRTQLELANKISKMIQPAQGLRPLFPEYRPNVPIRKGTAKEWWKYAVRCIGRLTGRRSWIEFYLAYLKRQRYIPLYKQAKHGNSCSWIKKISLTDQFVLDKIDMDASIAVVGIMGWRNMADAQVKRERRKFLAAKAKLAPERPTGYRAFFRYQDTDSLPQNDLDTIPITLTLEEMKELEDINLEHIADSVLSSDSKLYDFNFSLDSFKIDLMKSDLQPIARFQMGQMKTSFRANNDGSYEFGFTLSNMQVDDMVTYKTLFPSILQSLQSPSSSSFKHAFEFKSIKAKEGDQDILLKLVAFEIVASPEVLIEVKKFFKHHDFSIHVQEDENPILQQSITGDADIFYDAADDSDHQNSFINTTAAVAAKATTKMSDKLSNALSEAWKQKNVRKRTWTMDCNIHAPIIVIPQNVKDPLGTVLVLDMGNLHVILGNKPSCKEVENWFEKRMEKHRFYNEVDHWKLEMRNLTFLIGKAGIKDWKSDSERKKKNSPMSSNVECSKAIVQPLSIILNAGTDTSLTEFPLVCAHGELPSISVQLSPIQLSRILTVLSTWRVFLNQFSVNNQEISETKSTHVSENFRPEDYGIENTRNLSQSIIKKGTGNTTSLTKQKSNPKSKLLQVYENENSKDWCHISIALRRLSTKFETGVRGTLEAHLVSVNLYSTSHTDSSSSVRVCMGWFWILDCLQSTFPRYQRLLAHSTLPKSATVYASTEKYQIMDDLEMYGVFDKNYVGSSDLADISISKKLNVLNEGIEYKSNGEQKTSVDAVFSSLHINWNPQAIKSLLALQSEVATMCSSSLEEKTRLSYSQSMQKNGNQKATLFTVNENASADETLLCTSIKATMKKLELSLNSAKDDMPLFVLTMANSELNSSSTNSGKGSTQAAFCVGNIRIQTPSGRTYSEYNTIIGLAPNQSSSLLSIKYYNGNQAIASSSMSKENKDRYEVYAEVELSPMRIVYIQAQIMALVEFVTVGVLGAMAAQVASSAKAAALEVAKATQGLQLYQIKASGIDFLLPQAANQKNYFVLHAGAFLLWYRTLPDDGGEAKISLNEVTLESHTKFQIVANPITMAIDASLPSPDGPTIEYRALRINVSFSKANFLLSNSQYVQMMQTLARNISEADSFLRAEKDIYGGDGFQYSQNETTSEDQTNMTGRNLTHAGVSAVFIEKRMYLSFNFEEMTLELGGVEKFDPILSLSAVQTYVSLQFLPDKESMITDITLHNVEVDDRRLKSSHRHFRSLVSQVECQSKDIFKLSYNKHYNGSSSLDLIVGSLQVVLLPDVVNEALNFLHMEPIENPEAVYEINEANTKSNVEGNVHTDGIDKVQNYEIMVEVPTKIDITTKYSLKTSNCRFVLVDIGNETITDRRYLPKSSLEEVNVLTEAMVFQGKVDANMVLRSNSYSDSEGGRKIQFQAEQMQLYTGEGKSLDCPVQILEPVNIAVHLTKNTDEDGNEEVELKAVSLSPIDMTLSMQNAALLNAILSSISDSLVDSGSNDTEERPTQLSKHEAYKLERLSSALNETNDWESDVTSLTSDSNIEINTNISRNLSTNSTAPTRNTRKISRINTTIPEIVVTVVNDLQGLDQALFKVVARNVVSGAEISIPVDMPPNDRTFNAHVNASLLADYFDISTNQWMKFLREPWEVTISSKRTKGNKFGAKRFTTMLDIESHPCHISFSEQFLVGIGAAKQMWSMYSAAMSNATIEGNKNKANLAINDSRTKINLKKALAANAARALVTTMPYGINNHTGLTVEFSVNNGEQKALNDRHCCLTGDIKYFRFECPRVDGIGGKRVYGQDIRHPRSLHVFIGRSVLHFTHIDAEVNRPRQAHQLEGGQYIFTEFVNTGKATILHLSSHVHIYNCTNLSFSIAVQNSEEISDVGICHGKTRNKYSSRKKMSSHHDNMISTKFPSSLGVPTDLLHNFVAEMKGLSESPLIDILLCPHASDRNFDYERDTPPRASASLVGNIGSFRWGALYLPSITKLLEIGSSDTPIYSTEVACSMPREEMQVREVSKSMKYADSDFIKIQISVKVTLVDHAHPFVELFIQPRCILENKLPVSVFVRTPMSFTFSPPNEKGICVNCAFDLHDHVNHRLEPQQSIEVFSSGSSFALTTMCADGPVAGGVTGWCEDIVDIPLGIGFQSRLADPIRCLFPFVGREGEFLTGGGSEFYITESDAILDENNKKKDAVNYDFPLNMTEDQTRKIFITVQNYIVDHIGQLLFEPKEKKKFVSNFSKVRARPSRKMIEKSFLPWSAFASIERDRRLTLLPKSSIPIHLVELTIKGIDGMKKSFPFKVEEISIGEGGVQSSAIMWESNVPSGYFAYRQLRSFGQSEVHIVPEFVAFNGSSENTIVIKQPQSNHIVLGPGKIAPLSRNHLNRLIIMIEVLDLSGSTSPIQVDELGMRLCVVKSNGTGTPLGSIAIQTVVGGKDSRLVIKIGAVTFGGKERIRKDRLPRVEDTNILSDDFLRFRVRWTELKISLSDTQLATKTTTISKVKGSEFSGEYNDIHEMVVIEFVFNRFTIDFQRIFKDDESGIRYIQSPERSQLAVVVHNMRILDCVSNSQHPVVFDGFTEQSVFDLCVRFRGPINAELIKVELLDVNLAYSKKKKSNTIVLNASEDFIWRLLDVINRIMMAIDDLAGFEMVLDWNDEASEFEVSIIDANEATYTNEDNEVTYSPPQSDKLFDIKIARVSPIRLQFSFQRHPQASRYFKRASSAPGAKLMNYFTHRLKFTIQNADLKFAGYITRNMKGPFDRVIDTFKTYYISRIKMQFVALMSAASLQNWKSLTSRENGDDEFEEGDILRLTGNIAGRSVGYVLKKFGEGVGDGVSTITHIFGNEFEKTTELIGAGAVGVRVNNLVTGVGDGVGNTVKGVGNGAGNIIRGAGRGVGQIAGGLGGGVSHAVRGNFKEGAVSIGQGVGQGLETTVTGVADGVLNVGKGLFTGVKSIGVGIGGAFVGKKKTNTQDENHRK